jgi:hypothetical protein
MREKWFHNAKSHISTHVWCKCKAGTYFPCCTLIISLMMAQLRAEHVGYSTVNTKRQDQYTECYKNIYTQFKVNKYSLHNALNIDIWCTRKAGFVTGWIRTSVRNVRHQHLGSPEFGVRVTAKRQPRCVPRWMHRTFFSNRNSSSVAGFIRYNASFRYPHTWKSRGVKSSPHGGYIL